MRKVLFIAGILFAAACAGRASVSSGESDPSCTRMTWWLRAPQAMSPGETADVAVGHCIGRQRPVMLHWHSSDPEVARILAADADHAVLQAMRPGRTKITAWSESAADRSSVNVRVVTYDKRIAD